MLINKTAINAAGAKHVLLVCLVITISLTGFGQGMGSTDSSPCTGDQVTYYIYGSTCTVSEWIMIGTNGVHYRVDSQTSQGRTVTWLKQISGTISANCGGVYPSMEVTVNSSTPPIVSISSNANNVCEGTPITFSIAISEAGGSPGISWRINDVEIQSGGYTFVTQALKNNDQVKAVVTSNSPCAGGASASSNTMAMTIKPKVAESFIVGSQGPICSGEPSVSTATLDPSSLTANSYEWFVDGFPQTNGGSTYINGSVMGRPYNLKSGDISSSTYVISCKVNYTQSNGCVYNATAQTPLIVTSPPPFTVDIRPEPFRTPPVYCQDEIIFRAVASHPATLNWYKNGELIATGEYYDPAYYMPGDVLRVTASKTAGCAASSYAESTLDDNYFSIQEPIGPVTIYSNSSTTSRCAGPGVSYFYAVSPNARNFTWSFTPEAGTITPSGSNNSSVQVNWNANYTGTATVSVTAEGCAGDTRTDQYAYLSRQLPQPPASQTLAFGDFEVAELSASIGTNLMTFKWYTQSGQFLGYGTEYHLSVLPAGSYSYQVESVDAYGCVSGTRSVTTVNVQSAFDDRLNWLESTAFGIDSVGQRVAIGESRSYFDLSGAGLQTQQKNLSKGEIMSSMTIKDKYGRAAINTLPAPVGEPGFQYKHWFAVDEAGSLYDHKVLGNGLGTTPGTIGWYYSGSHTVEDFVPVTQYAYSRQDYYDDGTGEVRKSAAPGDTHKLGSGHEILSGTFPVYQELKDYLVKRAIVFPGIQQDTSLMREGVQSVVRDQNGHYTVQITDKSGNVLLTARPGTPDSSVLSVPVRISANGGTAPVIVYFYLLRKQPVTVNGTSDFVMEDLLSGQRLSAGQTFADPADNNNWSVGFYRAVLPTASSSIDIRYFNHFTDVSYRFYDDAGRLRCSISPNGMLKLKTGVPYDSIDKTTYRYNFQGLLLELKEPDAGSTRYVYRKDGQIRFSQNAQQKREQRFSYTHYDRIGRPVESGEYTGSPAALSFIPMDSTAFPTSAMNELLEKPADLISWGDSDRKDWVRTYYDTPVTLPADLPPDYSQDFIRGAVSSTENTNIQTWYSYDELGRVTWMAQRPKRLNRTFFTQYAYDFAGNVLTVYNASYKNAIRMDRFYHHYTYDADSRLSKAFTSPDSTHRKLRARYVYYLHGPLKRIVLGDQLQGIDFVYNIQGWLTQINHPDVTQDPGQDGNDVFGMVLDYYQSSLNFLSTTQREDYDPYKLHNLPVEARSFIAHHIPLPRFLSPGVETPGDAAEPFLKSYSAENPRYGKILRAHTQSVNR